MTFGVTAQGFNRKLLRDVIADLAAAQRAAIGQALDTSDEQPLGQINGTVGSAIAECWEILETAFHGFDPDAAADYLLTALSGLTGTGRRAAEATRVNATLSLNAGVLVPAGSIVAVNGRPDIRCTLDADVENTGGSPATFDGVFTCEQTGPIAIASGTLTVIVTPVSGWTAVTNAEDGETGRDVDTDVILRQRREDQLALRGGSTVAAIKADLLDFANNADLDGIRAVAILENVTDIVDADGVAPHSFEALVDDGDTPSVADDAIAQAIFESKPAGIRAVGNQNGEAEDANGDPHFVRFSRVDLIPIYFELTLTTDDDFPGDGEAQVKAAIVAHGTGIAIAQDVIALAFRAAALEVAGVVDVPTFTLGLAASPVGTSNIAIGSRARATFDTSRIEIA